MSIILVVVEIVAVYVLVSVAVSLFSGRVIFLGKHWPTPKPSKRRCA